MMHDVKVLAMTPEGTWNSHNKTYKIKEENMFYSEGQIIERRSRISILLEDIEDQERMTQLEAIISEDTIIINDNFRCEVIVVDIGVDKLASKIE